MLLSVLFLACQFSRVIISVRHLLRLWPAWFTHDVPPDDTCAYSWMCQSQRTTFPGKTVSARVAKALFNATLEARRSKVQLALTADRDETYYVVFNNIFRQQCYM